MTRIDTAKARRIHATADDMKHGDCHTARAVLTGMMPNILNEIDRLQAENQRLREELKGRSGRINEYADAIRWAVENHHDLPPELQELVTKVARLAVASERRANAGN